MNATPTPAAPLLRLKSAAGRRVVAVTVLGSSIAMLDATVVNVALPTIGNDFHAGFATLQWTINAYTLTLAAFLLVGGSLGDRFGRRRVFEIGAAWFGCASLLCALAPNGTVLVAARALQGIGGALLTPGSLAILEADFVLEDRAAAIGAWSGLGGVATAIGPLLGGWFVQAFSWRLVFLINPPVVAVLLWAARRYVPESRNPHAAANIDIVGAALAAVGLGLVVEGLIGGPPDWAAGQVVALIAGVVVLVVFVVVERTRRDPMLPLGIFANRQFSATNLVTLLVYGALGGGFFLLPVVLQHVVGFTPVEAGSALLPITAVLLLFSARAGRLAARIGPRIPMTVGPMLAGVGFLLMVRIGPHSGYLGDVFPAVVILAAGLALTVAPLTATVLAAASEENAGIASAINNDVARAGGLLAVAILPVAAGLAGSVYDHPVDFSNGFHRAVVMCAGLCVAGGLLAAAFVRRGTPPGGQESRGLCCPISAPPPAAARAPALSTATTYRRSAD